MLYIIPDALHDAIEAAIDREIGSRPLTPEDRQYLRACLLEHVNEHGRMPEFRIVENAKSPT